MKTRTLFPLSLVVVILSTGKAQRVAPVVREDAQMERRVDSILTLMTLEEKLGQLTQFHGRRRTDDVSVADSDAVLIREGKVGSFLGVYGAELTRRYQEISVTQSRLRIPLLFGYDVIHGFRTITPIPLAEASTWDPTLVERSARMGAVEGSAYGLHWTFAPMVDIARDPRWGRIAEGSGEDPYLGSVMAAARVRGFQGASLRAPGTLLACAKHFTAYGGAEGGRDYNTVDISERTLLEIYLPPFKAAVAAGVGSIMTAFNEIGGEPMSMSGRLINGTLRSQWGFDGFVVSDWTAILEMMEHGVSGTRGDAGVKALQAGVDMDMVASIYLEDLPSRVRAGDMPMSVVDASVKRILRAKFRLGLFDDPFRGSSSARQQSEVLTPENRQRAREISRASIVLLKNDGNVLPLKKDTKNIAVIGSLADDAESSLGTWAAIGQPSDVVTVLQGIRKAVAPSVRVQYAQGVRPDTTDHSGFEEALRLARGAEAVVLVVGETRNMSGEGSSRASLDLPGAQQELVDLVLSLGKPTVVVVASGRPLSISAIARDASAIVQAWHLGVETGHAVSDVLFGDYNPSGKLPVTVPRSVGQIPIYYNHKNTGRPANAGNHFTSKYIDLDWTPLFPFGFGLSYTSFAYSEPTVSKNSFIDGDSITVRFEVQNVGSRFGEEVAQLYIHDEVASVTPAVKQLKRFNKIALQPGEKRVISFVLKSEDLTFIGADLEPVAERGDFTAFVGGNSRDLRSVRFRFLGRN